MKRKTTFIAIALSCAMLATVSVWSPYRAAAAGGKDRTDLDVFGFSSGGSINLLPAGKTDWNFRVPGYNIVRSFTNTENKKVLFLLNSNTGEAETFELNANGSIGKSPWWTGIHPLVELRCTSAELVKINNVNKLITQDSFTGRVRV